MSMPRHPSLDGDYPDGRAPLGGSVIRVAAWNDGDEVNLASRTLARLAEFGIKVPSNSRLPEAKKNLERTYRFHVHFGPDDPATEEWVAEAKRTIIELSLIIVALASRAVEIRKQLQEVLGGPAVPHDGRQDKARDAQAELLVAAALVAGGYSIDFAEPDLVAPDLMGSRAGVAIKRVASKREDQIEKRLREARDQLVRNNLRGIIVVNAERHLARLYHANRGADLSAELFRKVTEWLDYIHGRDPLMHVIGVVGVSTSIRLVRHSQSFDFRLHFNSQFLVAKESETQALQEQFEKLSTRMGEGLQRIAQML